MRDSCPTLFYVHWLRSRLHSGLHCPWCYGREGGHSKSRGGCLRAPARGPGPLAPSLRAGHPMKGAHPLQNPRSNPTLFSRYWVRRWLHSGLHCPWCYGREGGHSKSRGGCLRAPARGPGPLASRRSPHEGGIPPSEPPFASHPLLRLVDGVLAPLCIARLLMLWRRGWDSNPRTVAGQRFSRPPDSATLAPLRTPGL